jgi:hypothetical protein
MTDLPFTIHSMSDDPAYAADVFWVEINNTGSCWGPFADEAKALEFARNYTNSQPLEIGAESCPTCKKAFSYGIARRRTLRVPPNLLNS